MLPGDTNLHNFEDAQYQLESFWASCPVPKSVLGYADDVNRDIFTVQQQEYVSTLESASEFAANMILKPVMSLLLLGEGQDILPSEIKCAFGSRSVFSAPAFLSASDALSKLPAGVLSREDGTRLLASLMDRDPEELIANVEAEEPLVSPLPAMPVEESK